MRRTPLPLVNLNNFIIDSLNEADLIPETFSLNNPYPNPFNPIVNIDFDVPNSDFVSIKIYDCLLYTSDAADE